MDGINYSECETPFKIYSNDINLSQINPKSASVKGGSDLSIQIDLDPVTSKSIQNLTVGFFPRPKKTSMQQTIEANKESMRSLNDSSRLGSKVNLSS
jgi:hypothetical protein